MTWRVYRTTCAGKQQRKTDTPNESEMWTKDRIVSAYQRATAENGGKPVGSTAFTKIVPERAWRGRFFARFSDLQRAAGYAPRTKNLRLGDEPLLMAVAEFTRHLGRISTEDERIMERRNNPDFPSSTTLRDHFGNSGGLMSALREFCLARSDYDDVLALLGEQQPLDSLRPVPGPATGFIYLMKYGRYYKIGFTNHVGRRGYEHNRAVPGKHNLIHSFETDDPSGIEAYWHNRFAEKRCEGTKEYFDLSPDDVAAFKRRKKFM